MSLKVKSIGGKVVEEKRTRRNKNERMNKNDEEVVCRENGRVECDGVAVTP